MGISSWEELLDLWREFGPAPIWNQANRALSNANRFKVNALGPTLRGDPCFGTTLARVGHHG
jgi:hypothetical protein